MATKRFEMEDPKAQPKHPWWSKSKMTPTKPFEPERQHKSGVSMLPTKGNFLHLTNHVPVVEKYERKPDIEGIRGEAIGLVPKRMQKASEVRWLFYVAGWDMKKISRVTEIPYPTVYSAIKKKAPCVQPENWDAEKARSRKKTG